MSNRNLPAMSPVDIYRFKAGMDVAPLTLGRYFELIRLARGLKWEDLASMLNMHQTSFGKLEKGFYNPTIDVRRKFAAVLGYPDNALSDGGWWMDDHGICHVLPGRYADGNTGVVNPGTYLYLARIRRQVTQNYITRMAQVNPVDISRFENGDYGSLDYSRKSRIAKLLGYPYGLLFAPEEELAARKYYDL